MSVSMYRGQVERQQREIAQLEARVADERSKAARERSEALRIRLHLEDDESLDGGVEAEAGAAARGPGRWA